MNCISRIIIITVCIVFSSSFFGNLSFAYVPEEGTERTFLISAYYSPLPDQSEYVWGSYEADIRVNGQGIAGADGTPVYVGMIAAPKSYPFGTKISIPGLGVGAVHDRGGAILASKNVDRLDVWMGYGDEGRKRALQWGMRTVVGSIMPQNTKETLILNGKVSVPVKPSALPAKLPQPVLSEEVKDSSEDKILEEGDSGKSVTNLQQFLYDRGFMEDVPTGYFGPKTKEAVIAFQEFYRIIPYAGAPGAGVFGPKTRAKLEEVWNEKYNLKDLPQVPENIDFSLAAPLQKGNTGDDVRKLQVALQGLGYFSETPNGVFGPATYSALLQFQKDHLLVGDETSIGAGILGPKTEKKLKEVMNQKNIKIVAQKK